MAKDEAVDPKVYLTKNATVLQHRFATWLQDEVGYVPASAKTKAEAFAEGVRLATATRMIFQASDYNREANAAAAAERAEARAAAQTEEPEEKPVKKAAPAKAAPAAKKAAPAKKAAAKKAAAPVEEPEADEEPEAETQAPVKRQAVRRAAPRRATTSAEAPF